MAMLPPAPGRLSGTTLWPSCLLSASAMIRAKMSVEPPAANGTIMRIGAAAGYGPAARAVEEVMPQRGVADKPARRLLRLTSIVRLRFLVGHVARWRRAG